MEIDTYAREKLELADGLRVTVNNRGLGSNGTESALKPGACPQTSVLSG